VDIDARRLKRRWSGRTGRITFSAVFKEQARSVAVLLRPEWGRTPWTRIEQNAIKDRAYDQGYHFATFIVTMPGTPIPSWLNKTHIWYDLQRFGLDGAAAVLARRIEERGGVAVEETLPDRAARLGRAQKFDREKKAFAASEEGVKASQAAYLRLISDIKCNSDTLRSVGCRLQERSYDSTTMVVGSGIVLTLRYECHYANSLDGAKLEANFYDGVPPLQGSLPHTLKSWKFTFQLVGPGRSAWVGTDGKEHPQEELAAFLLKHFVEQQHGELEQGQ
jgi:hypothetical protein